MKERFALVSRLIPYEFCASIFHGSGQQGEHATQFLQLIIAYNSTNTTLKLFTKSG